MAIARYLAMTAEEFAGTSTIPERVAWMACHFSPYSSSLLNLPEKLPDQSLLILNDSTPPSGQDPKIIAQLVENILKAQNCFGLLLDFQRPDNPETLKIAQELLQIGFPLCISNLYAKALDCPVFLPPPPLTVPLSEYIAPWKDRQIWLDTALSCEEITVTEKGSTFRPITVAPECPFEDKELHCHYHIASTEDGFSFTLQRTKEDLNNLFAEAETLGITVSVGLYQELK